MFCPHRCHDCAVCASYHPNHHQVRRVLYIIRDEYESSPGSIPKLTSRSSSTAADARGSGFHHQGECGPAIKGFKRRIGHAHINFTNLDLIFRHGVVHTLIDALSFGPLIIFLILPRDMIDLTIPKNTKVTKTCPKNN